MLVHPYVGQRVRFLDPTGRVNARNNLRGVVTEVGSAKYRPGYGYSGERSVVGVRWPPLSLLGKSGGTHWYVSYLCPGGCRHREARPTGPSSTAPSPLGGTTPTRWPIVPLGG